MLSFVTNQARVKQQLTIYLDLVWLGTVRLSSTDRARGVLCIILCSNCVCFFVTVRHDARRVETSL